MARLPSGPLGNAPRDQRDDFVGEPAEPVKAGPPPRWPPKPKKVTKNDFHSKVSGGNASSRADRAPHYRRGGFVSPRKSGGTVKRADGGSLRSESTEDARAKQTLRRNAPVTIAEDVVGAFSPSKAQSNSVRDAVRRGAADTIKASGGYESGGKVK